MITLPLMTIIRKWANALAESQDLLDFCEQKYNKLPTIFIGSDYQNPSSQDDYPIIILHHAKKIEGDKIDKYTYRIVVDWGIWNDFAERQGNIVEFVGIAEADEMGQIILDVISKVNENYPIRKVYYNIVPDTNFPFVPGQMKIKLEIETCPGYQINY